MCQAGAQVISGAIQKDLGLILHPAKRARMNDPCPVALEFSAKRMARLRILPAARVAGLFRKRRKHSAFTGFHFLACFEETRQAMRLRFSRTLGHN
jgi:hypothetical protein